MKHKLPAYVMMQKRQRRRSQQKIASHKASKTKLVKSNGLDDCGASCGRCDVCLAGS